jgi:hypothetical protein
VKDTYKIVVPEGKRPCGRSGIRRVDNTKLIWHRKIRACQLIRRCTDTVIESESEIISNTDCSPTFCMLMK